MIIKNIQLKIINFLKNKKDYNEYINRKNKSIYKIY